MGATTTGLIWFLGAPGFLVRNPCCTVQLDQEAALSRETCIRGAVVQSWQIYAITENEARRPKTERSAERRPENGRKSISARSWATYQLFAFSLRVFESMHHSACHMHIFKSGGASDTLSLETQICSPAWWRPGVQPPRTLARAMMNYYRGTHRSPFSSRHPCMLS